jgi:hypothetical protein
MTCDYPDCQKTASFNVPSNKTPRYCASHKEAEMINVKTRRCQSQICMTQAFFNLPGMSPALFCNSHKHFGMVNVIVNKSCKHPDCNKRPNFNKPGLRVGLYCLTHKENGMVNITKYGCQYPDCDLTASYNTPETNRPAYCAAHRSEHMINVSKPKCEHGKTKSKCKDCGGSALCKHDRERSLCVECGGNRTCPHKKLRDKCFECGGSSACEHGIQRSHCKLCGGSQICIHGLQRRTCRECDGSEFCVHNIRRSRCRTCDGSAYCEHETRKDHCRICDAAGFRRRFLCKNEWCDIRKNKKYKGYCRTCFMYAFPNEPVARNYKIKERHVVDHVKSCFPDFTWTCDKRYDFAPKDCASRRRPDMFVHFGTHVLIVEIDENQHKAYGTSCDNKRVCDLYQDFGHAPLVFIRFNPDAYIDANGKNITSCFGTNDTGTCVVKKSKIREWDARLRVLSETITKYTECTNDRSISQEHLFYDE